MYPALFMAIMQVSSVVNDDSVHVRTLMSVTLSHASAVTGDRVAVDVNGDCDQSWQ